jgi:hypothetical protein
MSLDGLGIRPASTSHSRFGSSEPTTITMRPVRASARPRGFWVRLSVRDAEACPEESIVNSIVAEYLATTFFHEYQALRDQLMEILTDDDLGYRVGAASTSLGALCRESGELERSYIESFRNFRQDFDYRNPDIRLERSVVALSSWYRELDRDLMTAVESLSEEDIANRKIIRSDFDVAYFAPLPKEQLDVYREALLIFYGKASVYVRAIGKSLPPQWQQWIG